MQESLRRFLQNRYDDRAMRYIAGFCDLDGDGTPEAIVYLISQNWCGSGGCSTLILSQRAGAWTVITKVSITRPPIRLLKTTSKGWRDLGVWVQGGGIQPGYEALLRFDGSTYPKNPSTPPARPLGGNVAGQVIIPSSQNGTPLFPVP